jgi:hypothetical protein
LDIDGKQPALLVSRHDAIGVAEYFAIGFDRLAVHQHEFTVSEESGIVVDLLSSDAEERLLARSGRTAFTVVRDFVLSELYDLDMKLAAYRLPAIIRVSHPMVDQTVHHRLRIGLICLPPKLRSMNFRDQEK